MDPAKLVRFGVFEADLSTGELRKHGIPVKLQEQPAKILAALLEHPGQVVSRDDLVKLLWPEGTFVDYDRGLNAAINRLRQALSDSAESPRYVETVARRGYRFHAPVEPAPSEAGLGIPAQARVAVPRSPWIAAAGGLAALGIGIWLWRSNQDVPEPPLQPVPLTSYEGMETEPSFSPDGSQVAFSWNGERLDNFDIYVKALGSDPPLRLTTDPAADSFPSWSPDGRYLAFDRAGQGIYVVPPTGGPERRLVPPRGFANPVSWSPDAKYLAFAHTAEGLEGGGIFLVAATGGAVRKLTAIAPGYHRAPAFSPDGRSLAFASCQVMSCDIAVVTLDAGMNPRGSARIVARRSAPVRGIAWVAGGQALVFTELVFGVGDRLWKVAVRDPDPELLTFAGDSATSLAISRAGRRLAFSQSVSNWEIWEVRNDGLARSPLSSTYEDSSPQFSPDGKRVALRSARSGSAEIWVANTDGSNAMRLTSSKGSGTPRWSPDGRWIAYDTIAANGRWDVNVIEAAGGEPTPVVRHPFDDAAPGFSHDGKWIYFWSNRDGTNQIYRVSAAGGEPVRVTDSGGRVAFESPDGESINYTKGNEGCGFPLFVRALAGGPERQVLDSVCPRSFAVTERGIYYTSGMGDDQSYSRNYGAGGTFLTVRLFDPITGKSREVRRTPGPLYGGALTVSPDGITILLAGSTQTGGDLMLVENFR